MVTPYPASESPSWEGTRNVPRSDCSLVGNPKCLDTSLNFFFINFCNVHHQLWLSSPFTGHPGELAFNFAILHDIEQLVQHPTRIPDRLEESPAFFTFSLPLILRLMLLPSLLRWLLRSQSHFCILSYFSNPSSGSPKAEVAFTSARWGT
ncbi:hypothetical protein E2C01_061144 [Portunus trituberculatus]|uniref:Uncharacterized protein n=1 Tax=Portunus trituberculatus TaxID=210409 RepID=A0A5B7HE95_PORTR|nr:hypothetical protein [Portunus trituberculatus]